MLCDFCLIFVLILSKHVNLETLKLKSSEAEMYIHNVAAINYEK